MPQGGGGLGVVDGPGEGRGKSCDWAPLRRRGLGVSMSGYQGNGAVSRPKAGGGATVWEVGPRLD